MDLSIYPLPFFLSAVVLILCAWYAWKHRRDGWGLPMLAVLGTVAAWYHGDGLYNDYDKYKVIIGEHALNAAWWQVMLFLVVFALTSRSVHEVLNKSLRQRHSGLIFYLQRGKIADPVLQTKIDRLTMALLICWLILMAIALSRRGWDLGPLFFPYLEGWKSNPWARGRVGGGISALLSLAGYLQIFLTASFGVVAAIAKNPKTKIIAISVCFLAFPYYIFDRTRNPMIATMLPGILAWVFFGLKIPVILRAALLLSLFLLANYWMLVVVQSEMNRGLSVGDALKSIENKENDKIEGVQGWGEEDESARHRGLSMFSELGYINNLIDGDLYQLTWGGRYYAEVVNFIPRGLWENKPLVGIDYAIARGFGTENISNDNKFAGGGVTTSIATGMIGQGVVNFGRFFGPMAAALLMSFWVAILARMDLKGDPARLLLCGLGMILTFNMGRDITLFVLYPFVFGYMLLLAYEKWQRTKTHTAISQQRGVRRLGSSN